MTGKRQTIGTALNEMNAPAASYKLNVFKSATAFHNLVLISWHAFLRKKERSEWYKLEFLPFFLFLSA